MKPLILICTSIFVFGMFLTACTTPDPIIEERIVEVEKIVVVEKIVEVVVEVTATAEAVDSSASVTVDSILGASLTGLTLTKNTFSTSILPSSDTVIVIEKEPK